MSNSGATKQLLAETLAELMTEKALSAITVADIVTRCELNRNSFYYHFKDKYDLVNWIFYTEIAAEIVPDDDESKGVWDLVEKLLLYFDRRRDFYRAALAVEGPHSFAAYFARLLKNLLAARLGQHFSDYDQQNLYEHFLTDALSSAIFRWLKTGAQLSPPQMLEMMQAAAASLSGE